MKLAIADPPYLGRAGYYSGQIAPKYRRNGRMSVAADAHERAADWDDPQTHAALLRNLDASYDGYAIAMSRDSLPVYLTVRPDARVCVWHNPAAWPQGGAIHATWEPVLIQRPDGRPIRDMRPKDVLIAVPPRRAGFIGAKPKEWTRWVLDMLGYDQDTDTVDDLFGGSGAVSREISQLVIPL